jgi:hypothetical protein
MLKIPHTKGKIREILSIIGVEIFIFASLMSIFSNMASASSQPLTPHDTFSAPALQSAVTPIANVQSAIQLTQTVPGNSQNSMILSTTAQIEAASVYSFSLAALGYSERTLTSPSGTTRYLFRLPENWLIQTDGMLNLDLSYVYNRATEDNVLPLVGSLKVILNEQTLEIFPFAGETRDHYRLSVPLPSSLLANRTQHTISLRLEAEALCEIPHHKAELVIYPTSSIILGYEERPLVPDLSRYPRPFYQRAFEPDKVGFVLPSQLPAEDVRSALAIAAKLGDLTSNRLVISATTDLDLSQVLSSTHPILNEHLIVVGAPQDNQWLRYLNDVVDLPAHLYRRQLGLISQGPAAVARGDTFTYTFMVTNTIDRAVEFSLLNSFPAYTELVNCMPACMENTEDNTIVWNDNSLAPTETSSFVLTLKAAEALTGTVIENTVTLIEAGLGPVNADTMITTIVAGLADHEIQRSTAGEGYFFTYNGRAIAKEDGIVQEIVSPWNENRAILIITGLNDEAVRKAGQAMSSEVNFPGMSGNLALIKDVLVNPGEDQATSTIERSFADLGYDDEIVWGGHTVREVDYWFDVPYGWELTEDAFLELYFNHSQLIDYKDSGLTVFLNRQPVASIAFNEETANNGRLHISLRDANVRAGESNRLTIRINVSMPGQCVDPGRAWVLVKDSSKIFLAHNEETDLAFDLRIYPYPFHLNSTLSDLLFVLPDVPTIDEVEDALHLATALGNSAGGDSIWPSLITASDPLTENLGDYHIIALGRPSRNAIIQEVNGQLPQPFLPNSDQIDQRLDDVILRLPPNIELGYLQLLRSPWNEAQAFLAVTGTTDQAVNRAADILAVNRSSALKGNLALIKDNSEIKTVDTRQLTSKAAAAAIATALPEAIQITDETQIEVPPGIKTGTLAISTPVLTDSSSDTPASKQVPAGTDYPVWIMLLVAATGLIVAAIFGFVFWQSRWRT